MSYIVGLNNIGQPKIHKNVGAVEFSIFPILLPVKLSIFIFFGLSGIISLLLFFFPFLQLSLLKTIAISVLLLFSIDITKVGRAITIRRAIHKRRYETIYKPDIKHVAKSLRATTIAKLEERYLNGEQ